MAAAQPAPLHTMANGNGTLLHERAIEAEEKVMAIEPRSKGGVPRRLQRSKRKPEDESLLGSLCTLICNNQLGRLCIPPGRHWKAD